LYGGQPELVLRHILARQIVVLSDYIIDELVEYLKNIHPKVPQKFIRILRQKLSDYCFDYSMPTKITVRDINDTDILRLAIAQNACIITGDKDIIESKGTSKVAILTIAEYVELFELPKS
jgi:predicted nucleic acid-binding protein